MMKPSTKKPRRKTPASSSSPPPSPPAVTASTPRTLADLIQPLDPETFLRSTWGKRFVHLRGPKGKFGGLMPWASFNDILTDQTLPQIQLMLWRHKQLLKFPIFKERVEKIRARELLDELNRGATLVLNSAEKSFGPLRDLTDTLQSELRAETFANLYASWKAEPGFGVHRDKQHTLIVQVHGRKHWKVYAPSPDEPTDSVRPLWSGTLEEGDLLHIPKGFWHDVVSVNEPSLHLTITVLPVEPGDLLQWIANQALDPSGWKPRSDVPMVGSEEEKRRWIRHMQKKVAKACTDDVIDRFFAEREALTPDRPQLDLPALGPDPIGLDTPIRLLKPRLHIVRDGAKRISLRSGHATWGMSKRALPVLKTFSDRKPHTLREVLARHGLSKMAESMLVLFQDLVKNRVIGVAS